MTLPLYSSLPLGLRSLLFAALFVVGSSADEARAQGAPDSLSFQGRLTDSGGAPLDTTVSITFKLYKNGTAVWTETQPSVDVTGGLFNVLLGSVTLLDTVAFDQPIELGITVGADSEIAPKSPLAAGAFALGMRGMYAVWADNGPDESYNIVGGASNNSVAAGVVGATIGGGGGTYGGSPFPNTVTGDFGTVGGGLQNTVGGMRSTVSGGRANSAVGFFSTVGGGQNNSASSDGATVGGGNNNAAGGGNATIGGGLSNTAGGLRSTIGGGNANSAVGFFSTVGGGQSNSASSDGATVGGGTGNAAGGGNATVGGGDSNTASGIGATVGGGFVNTASGASSTVPGGQSNVGKGFASLAAGWQARANHHGVLVWQDSSGTTDDTLASTAVNQFIARASGGFFFYTGSAPDLSTGTSLPAGSGTWGSLSSRASKTNLSQVDAQSYLDRVGSLDLKQWSYKTEEGVTHVGPMAEDFYAAFGHGPSEKSISTVDADGVALAAIKGLLERIVALEAEVSSLKKEQGLKKRRS